jgi:hypothetical protein
MVNQTFFLTFAQSMVQIYFDIFTLQILKYFGSYEE